MGGWTKKSSPETGFKVMNVENENATRCRVWTPEKSEGKENLGNYQLQTTVKAMELSQVKAVAAETNQRLSKALGPQESTKETEKEWPLRQEENDHVSM